MSKQDPMPLESTRAPDGKRRVLFVDDDPSVLRALKVMLRGQSHAWEMEFVVTGDQALQRVRAWAPHVVVCDQKMPGMDGAALFEQVRQERPSALRILLSGQGAPDGSLDEGDKNEQFLEKPLKPERLKQLIDLSMDMDALVPDEALRRDIAALSRLPMLKPAERRLIGEMDLPGASMQRAAQLVEHDPELAAMALRMVHSASLAVPQRVDKASQAALMLGFDNLRGLVFAAGSFRSFDPQLKGLGEHLALLGAGVACAARREAVRAGATAIEESEAFTAGLLADIGILVLSTLRPELARQWQSSHPNEWPAGKEELAHFGATHAGSGAYLLSLWGLPGPIVNAVAWHLDAEQGGPSLVLAALAKVTKRPPVMEAAL